MSVSESEQAAKRGRRRGVTFFAEGEPMVWVTGGALAVALLMIIGTLGYVLYMGTANFWPLPIVQVETVTGETHLGEVTRYQTFVPSAANLAHFSAEERNALRAQFADTDGYAARKLVRTGNYDLTGTRFHWVSEFNVEKETRPDWAMMFERMEWGLFYGHPKAFLVDGEVVAETPSEIWRAFRESHATVRSRWRQRKRLETLDIGRANRREEEARLAMVTLRRQHAVGNVDDATLVAAEARFNREVAEVRAEHARITEEIAALNAENNRYVIQMVASTGQEKGLHLADIVRAHPANQLTFAERVGVFFSRWREFLFDDPREANTEGGVYPAIIGTVTMTLVMTLFVVPFGVLAALYLREYAKSGPIVSSVRIAINNLAGVPSIVFGVFGLGFFCYIFGGYLDEWFYAARLPAPTFRKGGVLWASATLALLTLPVVIVATEEALAAVPGSMREGSYACGASKWQTIKRIVLPRAMPGIMTGMILAMARGAGEVAPLMLVGAVKLAPDLPFDFSNWSGSLGPIPTGPIHLSRSFMHLGFHIYDVGFQSPDSEAARPMVFTTTLLLIAIIVLLNIAAMVLRARLRKRFATGAF
ncbi:MAG: phosphate ABC transporter permease PstA [Kiritimatiellia bacterium]